MSNLIRSCPTAFVWFVFFSSLVFSDISHGGEAAGDGAAVKKILTATDAGQNLLKADAWHGYEQGFEREGDLLVCDNGSDTQGRRGVAQTVVLNQSRPEPIIASAFSRSEGVGGSPESGYSIYLDLVYSDGTQLWGQAAPFDCGTHHWQRREVVVMPAKPVKQLSFYLLLRGREGKAWFRDARLEVVRASEGASLFDGVAVQLQGPARDGFQLRDVAAGSDFVQIARGALGLKLETKRSNQAGVESFDVQLTDTTGRDRAVTLVYAIPVAPDGLQWLENPRRAVAVEPGTEYMEAGRFHLGTSGRVSRYPFAAVAGKDKGTAIGIDMAFPAVFRAGYNPDTGELFLAYDLGFAPEKPTARLRFCRFDFEPEWGFRSALATYYQAFPEAFRCLTPEQGLWMPFAKISAVEGWEDFGFKFKEGDNETGWDDQHDITTFRYTEPMTWWMRMPTEMPRTFEAALAEAERLAVEKKDPRALAFRTSAFHDATGRPVARLLDTPWCNGAVWSINGMPGIQGDVTDFGLKWNADLRDKLYGPKAKARLDGEYIDSSEGYVTAELDFRRDHFAAAQTPLTFSSGDYRPAIFRGLITFEYIRAIADDVHKMDRLMMANSTPIRLCWLAPLLEVMGTETDWHRGKWQPMSDAELLYRRAMCKGKPFCFLMNTRFEEFSHELVERYMKRSLAYGMFPGFFSHNASQGHYFTRPELYNRDRPLFKKYVPLCKLVAEAGWEPVTLARSNNENVYVERFGDRYLTVFNDSTEERTVTIELDAKLGKNLSSTPELVGGTTIAWKSGKATMTLGPEDVAVIGLTQE